MVKQGSTNACIADMWKELATMQYKVSMGEEKFQRILQVHKEKNVEVSSWYPRQWLEDLVSTGTDRLTYCVLYVQ